jgi:hypothetical protein
MHEGFWKGASVKREARSIRGAVKASRHHHEGDTMTRLILLALLLTTPAHTDWPSGISSCAIARSVAQFVG